MTAYPHLLAPITLGTTTLRNRTLPAQVMSSLNDSPLYFRYAGGFFMMFPALIFIFIIRKYLLNLWGSISR